MRFARILQTLAWLAYPPLIYFGLQFMQPRYVAAFLLLILIVRKRSMAQRFMADLSRLDMLTLLALLLLAAATALTNSELLLRLYPAAVSAGMLSLFWVSLHRPPSMIERFARLQQPELPAAGVAYTRKVTRVWCVFLGLNCAAALYTALCSSREIWSLYNGLVFYVLMGALLAAEWLYRKRFLQASPH